MRHDLDAFAISTSPERGVRRYHLLAFPVAWLAIDNALLLAFLGKPWPLALASALVGLTAAAGVSILCRADTVRIAPARLLACLGLALVLLLLGGEGGMFYANTDWQVRNALLRDMARFPWPFAYAQVHGSAMLRAPIGMYLLPALGGEARAPFLLLLQNTGLIGTLLAVGSSLFDGARARRIAALVVIGFSGMDALGAYMVRPDLLASLDGHLEAWAGIQYSSTITLLFWVPHHAFVGWFCGLLFLLWRRQAVPLGAMLAPVPLLALWSPLALAGALPFAALAAVETIATRRLRLADLGLPALATIAALPALAYLTAGAGAVGTSLRLPGIGSYIFVELFEVLPFVLCLLLLPMTIVRRIDIAMAGLILFVLPVIWIGWNCDFMMRASIPALTVLAVGAADALATRSPAHMAIVRLLIVTLLIGVLTPMHEIVRAVRFRANPSPECPMTRTFWPDYDLGFAQYMTSIATMRSQLRPETPFIVTDTGRSQCWDRPWAIPR